MGSDALGPKPGDTIGSKYRLTRVIGEGGMATVFEAEHLRFQTSVAVKIFDHSMMADGALKERFELEARVLARVRSLHMVDVLDADVLPNGVPYIVMELLKGCDLETELHHHQPHLLAIEDAVDYVVQAAAGMSASHANGIVHRDLKPANLFLCTLPYAPERRLVKVVDFGIARIADGGAIRRTSGGDVFGTPQYMAPEQVWSARNAEAATDQWALGVVLFELLAGRPPFEGESPSAVVAAIASQPVPRLRDLRGDIAPDLEAIVMRALSKEPKDRFPSLVELCAALAPFGHATPISSLIAAPRASVPDIAALDRHDTQPPPRGPITERSWESGNVSRPRVGVWAIAASTAALVAILVAGVVTLRMRATPATGVASASPAIAETARASVAPAIASSPVAAPQQTTSPSAAPPSSPRALPSPAASTAPPSRPQRVVGSVPPAATPRKSGPRRDPLAP